MIERVTLVLYVLWRAVLVVLAFCGWLVGMLVGTLVGGLAAGFKRGYTG
jgi:hypothetical protein